MVVFEWIVAHFDPVLLTLTVLLNLLLIGSHLVRAWKNGSVAALSKWLQILEAAREYEQEAEGFSDYSAAEKLNYVLSRLRALSEELAFPCDEERLIEIVEKDIAFSRVVNAPDSKEA